MSTDDSSAYVLGGARNSVSTEIHGATRLQSIRTDCS